MIRSAAAGPREAACPDGELAGIGGAAARVSGAGEGNAAAGAADRSRSVAVAVVEQRIGEGEELTCRYFWCMSLLIFGDAPSPRRPVTLPCLFQTWPGGGPKGLS
eukprot:scaffold5048_cov102-Isochrysis_galbana.AAC.2